MGQANIWVMDIIGPAILLILLILQVIYAPTARDRPDEKSSDQASSNSEPGEPQRRREGIEPL